MFMKMEATSIFLNWTLLSFSKLKKLHVVDVEERTC